MADETYKEWIVRYDPPPIPTRDLDWIAVHPNYDGWTQDGEWVSNGMCIHAPSREALIEEIDNWEDDNGSA